jgi:AcrR family transcriptional regulator
MAYTEKHSHIIQTAEKLFAEKGYEATTVRDIAEAAGINLAMISYYFGSKEKLLEALFDQRMQATTIRIREIGAMETLDPWQKLEILIDEYINRAMFRQEFYKVMICEQVINKNTQVLHNLKCIKLEYANLIGGIIAEGQKKKMFGKNIDTVMLLTSMTGTVMHMLVNQDYYREFLKLGKKKDEEFKTILTENLRKQVRTIFKATLDYER